MFETNVGSFPWHLKISITQWLGTVYNEPDSPHCVQAIYENKALGNSVQKEAAKGLAPFFRSENNNDVQRVKKSLTRLVHGHGDFIERLHDLVYDPAWWLEHFGRFCALELFGTIKPEEFPPINGRMAKALRFLGYDVKTS